MCTAVLYCPGEHYFGRNLDLEYSYRETVTITPRNYRFSFHRLPDIPSHYAMIGMATVSDGYPLYYEATNEKGVSMAGLNFPENAVYLPPSVEKDNVAPFELIPWVLSRCENFEQVKDCLKRICIADIPFSKEFPNTPLHWIIAHGEKSLIVEPLADGLRIYENPFGVLTNNPPFDYHLHNIVNYLNLTPDAPVSRFCKEPQLTPYSRGMGAIGLPGDLSSASRFVRAAFTKSNSVSAGEELTHVSQFFHILDSVAMVNGCVRFDGKLEKTVYSCCCNADRGIFYYTTYENRRITAVDMHRANLDSNALITYSLKAKQDILLEA